MSVSDMSKKKSVKKAVLITVCCVLAVILLLIGGFAALYATRFASVSSIEQITEYDDGFDIYRMDIKYDYSIDDIIDFGLTDDQAFMDAVISEALPLLPVKIKAPNFACSAFCITGDDGDVMMGRNYDFKKNTSSMLVYCDPDDGYSSVAFAALSNIGANDATASIKSKLACLTAPFICLDGMNEKGVSIAVLTLDSDPTVQNTEKPNIATTIAIRLVLDRAATTEEAVELLRQYDMVATSGRDYHFYITDASGDGRVVEYDCHSESRELVATPTRTITNFFALYIDKVTEAGKNGIYGHGKERYDSIEAVFDSTQSYNNDVAWQALKAAAQLPSETEITSNTQWSIVFNNTDRTLEIVMRRNWNDVFKYDLGTNELQGP